MSISPNHARILSLTARQSDLQYRLTMLVSQNQKFSTEQADLLQQKSSIIQSYLTAQKTAGSEDQTVALDFATAALTADIDSQLAAVANAQNRLDLEQKRIETNHKAVTTEKESVQKVLDNSIKTEMNYFSN